MDTFNSTDEINQYCAGYMAGLTAVDSDIANGGPLPRDSYQVTNDSDHDDPFNKGWCDGVEEALGATLDFV